MKKCHVKVEHEKETKKIRKSGSERKGKRKKGEDSCKAEV